MIVQLKPFWLTMLLKKEIVQKTKKSTQTTEIKTAEQKARTIMEIYNHNTNDWECFSPCVGY